MELISVFDTQKNQFGEIVSDELHTCDRCGKQHAKVFEILDNDKNVWLVGSTCCKRMFRWMPSSDHIKCLEWATKIAPQLTGCNWDTQLARFLQVIPRDDRAIAKRMVLRLAGKI